MRVQPSDINGLLGQMTDAKAALNIYLSNREGKDEEVFFDRYFELLEHDTESFFTGIVNWYTSKIVLPVLFEKTRELDKVVGSQREIEENVIGRELLEGCTILDIGCGPGRIPFLFHDHPKVKRVYAFDISKGMIKMAEQIKNKLGLGDKISFFRADVINLPKLKLKGPVVVTCSYGTYGGIRRLKDRIAALRSIKKNADKLVISAYNMKHIGKAKDYYNNLNEEDLEGFVEIRSKEGDKTYITSPTTSFFSTWFTEEGLRREFEMAGLNPRIEDHGEQLIAVCDLR